MVILYSHVKICCEQGAIDSCGGWGVDWDALVG